MKMGKFEEEKIVLSQNASKDESKYSLLRKNDSISIMSNLSKRPGSQNILIEKKRDHSKTFKEDENSGPDKVKRISDKRDDDSPVEEYYGDEIEANRRLFKKEKICDTDTEDEGSDEDKNVNKWVLLPDHWFKKSWDLLIALLILYSSIVTPYKIAFIDEPALEEIDIGSDVILALDILINFFSAYVDNEDNVIKDRKMIVKTYLKSWFAIDISSILPISYFTDASFKFNNLTRIGRLPKLYRLLKLTKLLRMSKIAKKGNVNRIAKFFLEKFKVNTNIERLIYFILSFLLLNHLSACIWFFVAKLEDLSPDSWVTRLGYIDSSNFEIYVISFYWTLTTVTTVGYGDINAGTTLERAYNLIIMSFGVLMYSFAIGSLSSIVSTLDQKTAEMNQKLQILSSIKKEFNLEQEIYEKVRKVIKYDLSRNQKDKMNFLQELPNKLRIELSQIMHDKAIQNLYFFKDQPLDFIAYVAPLLKPVKFSQDDYLYKHGDMIDEMYFVSKGTVILCLHKKYEEKEITEIKKNNNFGEIEMCLNEKLEYNIKIKSKNCELFVLKKNDFLRLSVNFKEFIENFLYKSLMKFLKFSDIRKKMIREEDNRQNKINIEKKNKMDPNKGLEPVDEKEEDCSEESYCTDESSEEKSDPESKIIKNQNNSELSVVNEDKLYLKKESKVIEDFGIKSDKNPSLIEMKDNKSLILNNMNKNLSFLQRDDSIRNKIPSDGEDPKDNNQENAHNSDDSVDKYKTKINKKFVSKIDKILEYLEKNGIEFSSDESKNPKALLMRLRNETNILEKNQLIDQIETILKDFYKSTAKK